MKENWNYHRGDIYLVDLGTNIGTGRVPPGIARAE